MRFTVCTGTCRDARRKRSTELNNGNAGLTGSLLTTAAELENEAACTSFTVFSALREGALDVGSALEPRRARARAGDCGLLIYRAKIHI